MVKLFLKMYGFLIVTLGISFYIQTEVIHYYSTSQTGSVVEGRFSPTFFLVEETLRALPQEVWPARFADLRKGFLNPVYLESLGEVRKRLSMNDERFARLESEKIVLIWREEGGFFLAKRLQGSNLGLIMEFPGPRSMDTTVFTINWVIEFIFVAALLIFWVRPFWRDLMKLHHAAEKAGDGHFNIQVEMKKGSPLFQFAQTFNDMTQRIGDLLKAHKSLTNSVSHELRTPLARLRFSQHLGQEEHTIEGKDRYLSLMERDINELDELSTELLTYAKLERGTPEIAHLKIPARTWFKDIVSHAEEAVLSENKNIQVTTDIGIEELTCEPRYMGRAVSNLLRNALRYARSQVGIVVQKETGYFVVHVDDDGPGIPLAERERLFEPFARMDHSRDRSTGGFGMGLAIVKQIAAWHGGTAVISDSALGGARLTLKWPLTT